MKTTYTRYFTMAASVLLLSACVEEKLDKAAPDREDCMGVYFVEEQENAKNHTLEKDVDETYLDFTVRRTNTDAAETVPYDYQVYRIIRTMQPGDTTYIEEPLYDNDKFKFGKLTFEKGQRETTVRVDFAGLSTGEKFMCSMSINDPAYAAVYGYNSSSVSFTVQMFEWKQVGKAIYRDALFSDMFEWEGSHLETEVDIYERKDLKGYYRMKNVYSPAYLARLVEGDEAYNENSKALESQYSAYVDSETSIYLDATDSSRVYFPVQKTGFSDPSLGEIYIASDVTEAFGTSSNLLYGKLSKDGVITFPENGVLFGMGGYFYFSNSSGKFRIVLPGGKAEDYFISIKADETDNGTVPVTFTVAQDVEKIRYKIFKGTISDVQMESKVNETAESGTDVTVSGETGQIVQNIKPAQDESGFYTLIACTYGEGDTSYREYGSVEFGYVKEGDEKQVQLYFGVHTDDHYASDKPEENYSSENSFQYWVRGKDITHAQISYYPTSYYLTYEEQIKEQMKSYGSVNAQTLNVLNKDGLAGVVGNGLKAGTSYTFVVYAGNGYHSAFFTDTINTRGITDLIQKSWYSIDIDSFSSSAELTYEGDWIPVSVDIFDSEAKGRTIRGNERADKVTLTTDGNTVTATGLFPSLASNPKVEFDLKEGRIYSKENRSAKVMVKDSTNIVPSLRFEYQYIPKTGALSGNGYFYGSFDDGILEDRQDMLQGGFVHEDIIAFTDNCTDYQFWAFVMGGYQKNSMGEEVLSTVIGDGHGDLILVRKDSGLLKGLPVKESESMQSGQTLSALTEAHRNVMPEINSIIKDLEKADAVHRLLEFREGVQVRSIMKQ